MRAARVLTLRTRRRATGLFAGSYASAFRGRGMDFEESRPYVPGDDPKHFDWNALARSGEPFVKHFREERNRLLLIGLDTSASMAATSRSRTKAELGAEVATLLAAAASRAGDRLGLVCFAKGIRSEVAPARSPEQIWSVAQGALCAADDARGESDFRDGLGALRARANERAIVVLLSDFRDPMSTDDLRAPLSPGLCRSLQALARRHELVCTVLEDSLERSLPRMGTLRLEDPERPNRVQLLSTGRARSRKQYEAAHATRVRALELQLRGCGASPLWLWTHRDPLSTLLSFFDDRARLRRSAWRPS